MACAVVIFLFFSLASPASSLHRAASCLRACGCLYSPGVGGTQARSFPNSGKRGLLRTLQGGRTCKEGRERQPVVM